MLELLGVLIVALGAIMFVVGVYAYNIFSYAFVLKILWAWFMVPHFSMEPLSLLTAAMLYLIVALLTQQHRAIDKDKQGTAAASIILRPWIFLLCGWVITFFV
jgi:hypothetical protein